MKQEIRKRWRIKQGQTIKERQLMQALGLSSIVARLLVNRGVTDIEEAALFLKEEMKGMVDPFLLKDMDKGVEEIERVIAAHQPIVVYGDYDVDGITATSLLYRFLKKLGASVTYYIPERQSEGYGLNLEALEHIIERGAALVITVDCGISSYDIVEAVKDRISIVITDHHMAPDRIPNAKAVINHKQPACTYPDKNLAGVGVAFKLCQAIYWRRTGQWYLEDLDIVALGTVADIVPLVGENRVNVAHGLEKMTSSPNVGIQSLIEVAGLEGKKLTSGHIGFTLAPRLNAAGRVTHATRAVELLISTSSEEAYAIAEELQVTNAERQGLERDIHEQARLDVINQGPLADKVIVVGGENWHPGVIGIVASRLVEEFYRPTLVISLHDGIGKGSCRSIDNFNIYEGLKYCEDLLIQFGGHSMAAGFSIEEKNIPVFRERLSQYCSQVLTEEDYIPIVDIDLELNPSDVEVPLIDEVANLEPYGMGNATPVFAMTGVSVSDVYLMGKQKNHCKIVLKTPQGTLDAIAWSGDYYHSQIFPDDKVKVAFSLQKNEWQGTVTPQLIIQDIQVVDNQPIHLTVEGLREMYSLIRHICKGGSIPKYILESEIIHKHPTSQNVQTAMIAIEVFKDLGILKEVQSSEGMAMYAWCQVTEKIDLVTSLTFIKYSS